MSFTIQTFLDFSRVHANRRREVYFVRDVLAQLRQAGEETGLLTSEAIRNQGCCVYAACTLVDVLQQSGFNASLRACGLAFASVRNGRINGKLIGSPEAADAPFPGAIDGHAVVSFGTLILDPTFGQLSDGTKGFPDSAIFGPLKTPKRIALVDGIDAEQFAQAQWRNRDRGYFAGLYELPPALKAAADKWQSDPSVAPDLRRPLVLRTLELMSEPSHIGSSRHSGYRPYSPAGISRTGPNRRQTARSS